MNSGRPRSESPIAALNRSRTPSALVALMASRDPDVTLQASLLDRLIDPESDGTASQPGCTVEQMIDSVRRDLEDLLNTHRTVLEVSAEFPEVENSIVTYGLPDFSSFQSSKVRRQQQGRRADRAGHRPVRTPAPGRPRHADRRAR